MSLRTLSAPCALLLAASAAPAYAHEPAAPDRDPAVLDSVIVTGRRDAEGAVAVVSAESYETRFAQGFSDSLRDLTEGGYVGEFAAATEARVAGTAVFRPGEGRSAYVSPRVSD